MKVSLALSKLTVILRLVFGVIVNFFSNSLKTAVVFSLSKTEIDGFKNMAHSSFFKQKVRSRESTINKPMSQMQLTSSELLKDTIEVISPIIILGACLRTLPSGPRCIHAPFVLALAIYQLSWFLLGVVVYQDLSAQDSVKSFKEEEFWNKLLFPFSLLSTYELLRGATHVAIEAVEQLGHTVQP